MDLESLRAKLKEHKQEHLLEHWESLTDEQQKQLYSDLRCINFAEVNGFFSRCMEQLDATDKVDDHLQPIPQEALGSVVRTDAQTLKQYEEEGTVSCSIQRIWEKSWWGHVLLIPCFAPAGLRQISEGKVAVLLLAGGQGTRLGVPYPKGMYDVKLPSHKTLYQLQAERILKIQECSAQHCGKAGVIPWWVTLNNGQRLSPPPRSRPWDVPRCDFDLDWGCQLWAVGFPFLGSVLALVWSLCLQVYHDQRAYNGVDRGLFPQAQLLWPSVW